MLILLEANEMDMHEVKISTYWNGYCPESHWQGKQVRMRLNDMDFYESEATGLQLALLPGVQAVILNFRGEGKFRSTPSYADTVENGEILSPQNSPMPPFNQPTELFRSGAEVAAYIAAI
jgi:hypothetical protein